MVAPVSSTAQQLFELLKDARPKDGPRHSAPLVPRKPGVFVTEAALKAIRFSVELPELGGAVELCPRFGFDPVHCSRCGAEREQKQYVARCWSVLPCACRGTR
jgi:hypothetical protein